MLTPVAMASWASSQISARRACRPSAPSCTGHVMSIVCDWNHGCSSERSVSSSPLRRIGWSMTSWRACSGASSRRLPSAPTPVPSDMTIDSRIGSIGGLVTCAKSCLK